MDTMKLWFGVIVGGYGYKLCTCCKPFNLVNVNALMRIAGLICSHSVRFHNIYMVVRAFFFINSGLTIDNSIPFETDGHSSHLVLLCVT